MSFFAWLACIEKNKIVRKRRGLVAWDKKTSDIDMHP
jgi:hypothetical protein